MAHIIFDDLEIDYSSMMSNPSSFIKAVHEKAEELRSVLKQDDSISSYIKSLDVEEAPNEFQQSLDMIYQMADTIPISQLDDIISRVKRLAYDLETMKRDRAIYELAHRKDVLDKKTAHEQYVSLREAFNNYANAMETLNIVSDIERIPSMPGNYGAPVGLVNYVFEFDNGDAFRNYRAVAKRLSLEPVGSLMDVVEYIADNPDCGCVVKKVVN